MRLVDKKFNTQQLPGKAKKRHGSQYSEAELDINACYKGRNIQIEAKQPGKKPTPIQLKRLQEWQGQEPSSVGSRT